MKQPSEKESRQIPVNESEFTEEAGLEFVRPSGSAAEEGEVIPAEAEAQKRIEELDQMVANLREQLQGMENRWKRAVADLDNYRKRFERELERLRFAERDLILREWLAVVDNMERALKAENVSENPWYQGVQAIYQQMQGILNLFMVVSFNPKGERFDPERHDAVATVNLDSEPEGSIAEVVEPGYTIDGRILRPAKVIPVRHHRAE